MALKEELGEHLTDWLPQCHGVKEYLERQHHRGPGRVMDGVMEKLWCCTFTDVQEVQSSRHHWDEPRPVIQQQHTHTHKLKVNVQQHLILAAHFTPQWKSTADLLSVLNIKLSKALASKWQYVHFATPLILCSHVFVCGLVIRRPCLGIAQIVRLH